MSQCCTVVKNDVASDTCQRSTDRQHHQDVQDYYGTVLQGTSDLKTNVCTTQKNTNGATTDVRRALEEVHPEVINRYYGCGIPIPECIVGSSVLDLGCGSGRDCYVLSKIVGEEGQVTGVDMTHKQLEVALKFIDYHTRKFGYKVPNVSFVEGIIENLTEAGIESNHYDIVVSNCVVNLSPDKKSVLKEVYRVLKDGGEFYFSDVYTDRQLNEELKKDKVLWGECVSGALFWKDFLQAASEEGFSAPLLVSANSVDDTKGNLKELVGDVRFVSVTYRLFKLPQKELRRKYESGMVTYLGTIKRFPNRIPFSYDTEFETNVSKEVDYEIAAFLDTSRYRIHFKVKFDNVKNQSKEISKQLNPFDIIGKAKPKKNCCT